MILSKGHPLDLKSLHERGDRTRVSQAATVRVQTIKYLCALRWGGRLREFGSVKVDMVGDGEEDGLIINYHHDQIIISLRTAHLASVLHVLLPKPARRW